ncbi:hypothetical protein [Terrisporobacter sp.]|uniref:hypothetical protein n=1 Tax=Terrisporobacter sp. TaxID=1965305 RepID=UPI00399408E4
MLRTITTQAIEYGIVYGIENCKGEDWKLLDNKLIYINELGETIEFKISKARGKFVEFSTITKGKKTERIDSSHGSIVVNIEKVEILPNLRIDMLVDTARAYNAMQILIDFYKGFDYLEDNLKKIENEIRETVDSIAIFFDSEIELIETMEFFFEDKGDFEEVLVSIWDIIAEVMGFEMDYEEVEEIIENMKNEKIRRENEMFKTLNKRVYEMECKKGFFILEVKDIEETLYNPYTGETSKLKYELHYRESEDSGFTTFLQGGYIEKEKTEEKFVEEEYDFIVNTDFYDDSIAGHKRDLMILEEQFSKDFRNMNRGE